MKSITIRLPQSTYDVRVGPGLLQDLHNQLQAADLKGPYLVVTQPRILKAVGSEIRKKYPLAVMPDGERAKSMRTVQRLMDQMASLRLTRQSTLIALGGGVVGDVSGFAASIYMRGIAVVQVPTTLLAQVDSSIGGKTAVNHHVAKNMIGTFHQPALVVSDPLVLKTLPDREYASGLYEALKYGIIRDERMFEGFERNIRLLLKRDPETLEQLVAKCVGIKADVVMADEKEGDLRRILNFGHTIGHAIESALQYSRVKHGEAVGYGMITASRISSSLRKLPIDDLHRIEHAVGSVGRLPSLRGLKSRGILSALSHDKKVRDGAVHFVLPRRIGDVEITPDVPLAVVSDIVKELLDEGTRK
jgi:3-dehydroquinate synthase